MGPTVLYGVITFIRINVPFKYIYVYILIYVYVYIVSFFADIASNQLHLSAFPVQNSDFARPM
jgi:hypothetical protein